MDSIEVNFVEVTISVRVTDMHELMKMLPEDGVSDIRSVPIDLSTYNSLGGFTPRPKNSVTIKFVSPLVAALFMAKLEADKESATLFNMFWAGREIRRKR